MNELVVSSIGCLALFATCSKGPSWAFRWIYLPTLVLVPVDIRMNIVGLPDLTAQRAVCVGLFVGALLIRRARQLFPRWRWFDLVALLPVLSFSVSYSMATDFKGFYHRLPVLVMDWACPYLFTRALVKDIASLRAALPPLAIAASVLACLAVYECRMATRLAVNLWTALGVDVRMPSHFGSWRWGYLRAFASFCGPINLGTFFVAVTPLMVLWNLVDPKRRWPAGMATLACSAGCISSLSRGPILVLSAVAIILFLAVVLKRFLIPLLLAVLVLAAPFLKGVALEEVRYTQEQLDATGNTDSAHYRIALPLIYGKRIGEAGWWGNSSIIGREYELAYSMDNAYLYFFIIGGWLGGGSFLLVIVLALYLGMRRIRQASGREQHILATTFAGFAGVVACMANVWFGPDYAPFFWIVTALVFTQHSCSAAFLQGAQYPLQRTPDGHRRM